MPRAKYPPTPATSTGPIAQEKHTTDTDMGSAFILPPAAANRSPPTSPVTPRKRTLSGSTKATRHEELPPPPSRTRKIIQMKPKSKDEPPISMPATPTSSAISTLTSPKRKQPSATSAAGRKIARKTAHSIIERRRRSKMNEEFGVLKDMIPACKGVEMHKLAILQAGIEYVRYLQGCVETLQGGRGSAADYRRVVEAEVEDNVEEEDEDEDEDEDMEHQAAPVRSENAVLSERERASYRRESTATTATTAPSTHPSPALRPNVSSSSLASQRQMTLPPPMPKAKTYSTSPPPMRAQTPVPTGVSPAFNAIHFSPDLSRTISNPHQYNPGQPGKHSPHILPLPQAAMPIGAVVQHGSGQEGHAEATATAALMMLTNDRRGTGGGVGVSRSGGMSVRDLLSH